MIKKLIPFMLASLLTFVPVASAKSRVYGLIGSSSDSSNPFHMSVGGTLSKELGYNFSLGIDGNILLENSNYEISGALDLEKKLGDFSLGSSVGTSIVNQQNPLHISNTSVREPIPESSIFIRPYLTRKISNKIRFVADYTRNFANDEMFNNNYPRDRFSVGLSYKID